MNATGSNYVTPTVIPTTGHTGHTGNILATYQNLANAEIAISALHEIGVQKEDISLMTLDHSTPESRVGKATDDAAAGAWHGAKLGLVGGLLVGVAALAIPGLGALLAVGPLAAALGVTGIAGTAVTGAGIGTAVGGVGALVTSLVKAGVPVEHAQALTSDLQGGSALLSVKGSHPNVLSALQKGNPTRVVTA
jgi:hypothetical protein